MKIMLIIHNILIKINHQLSLTIQILLRIQELGLNSRKVNYLIKNCRLTTTLFLQKIKVSKNLIKIVFLRQSNR